MQSVRVRHVDYLSELYGIKNYVYGTAYHFSDISLKPQIAELIHGVDGDRPDQVKWLDDSEDDGEEYWQYVNLGDWIFLPDGGFFEVVSPTAFDLYFELVQE